ncbi:protein MIS12 homolog isoform X1 [Phyllobates terribilis]|uniref:protein MIS12 homolog isoform X1 n=1 Tax=Phyllobates terribilis TaxID=111132 RepID=UPI003CCB1E6D
MPRKHLMKSAVFEHFTVTQDKKHFVCQCMTSDPEENKCCDVKISAYSGSAKNAPTRASNLKRHLQRFHPEVFHAVTEKDNRRTKKPEPSTSRQAKEEERASQTSVRRYFVSDKVTVTMTADVFKRQLIELVVKDGVPLSLFARPAFTALNGEMARKLGVSLERESIRKLVIEEALNQKEDLKKTLKRRFVFLKMDACTRHRVNYFAINVRYVCDNNKIVTKTLAVKDTKAHHTSQFLQALVEKVLQDYELKKEQVLAIITDNASNISTMKLMNGNNEGEQQLEEHFRFSMLEMEGHSPVLITEEETDITTEEQQNDSSQLDDLVEAASHLSPIHHMRCVVHTLQLAIRDSLQEGYAATLISKVRKLAIAARTPKIDSILKRRAGKGAIVDQVTRWGSTYLMIERLLELKPFLVDMANPQPQVALNEGQWTQVAELKELLDHPFTVTKKLQAEDLTPGIIIKEWKNLLSCLSQKGGLIADGIAASMKRRETQLLESKILLAAVYVDPSHRILLDDQQLTKGKEALTEVAVRMSGLQDDQEDLGPASAAPAAVSSASSDEFKFEKYLDDMEQAKRCRREKDSTPIENRLPIFQQNFSLALKEVEEFNHSTKLTVHEAIPLYPEIVRDVARVVTALPPTQVSVERLFSSLKIIRSDLRSFMKEDLMEAILFLRRNS